MKNLSIVVSLVVGLFLMPGLARADCAATLAKCKACHGADSKGNPSMAGAFKVDLTTLDLTDAATKGAPEADLIKAITDGKNKMPSFKGKLSDVEIAEVAKCIKSP